jgi:hypothetical protein
MTNFRRDRSISDTRYIGLVCAKHPDLQGERNKRNHECVGCRRDMNKAYQKTEKGREAHRRRQKNLRAVHTFDREVEREVEAATRLKGMELSMQRFGNVEHWKELWDEAKPMVLKEMGLDSSP